MGLSSSVCSSEVGKDGAHSPGRPPLHSRDTGEVAAQPQSQPHGGNGLYYGSGYDRGYTVNNYGCRGYSQPPPLTSSAEPPPYYSLDNQPAHEPRDGSDTNSVATAARARPGGGEDPGDFWLNSELPPSSIGDDNEAFDNGDDVDDFDKPPDGHLVFACHKVCFLCFSL